MSREERVAEAFRGLVRRDLADGRLRSHAEYARLFPGFDEIVTREWEALAAERARAADATPAKISASPPSPSAESRPAGEYVGPYRLLREIGSGGQGIIWLAEDTRLPRRVALKVLPPALVASDSLRRRLQREAAAVARLDHPGIATVYEADVDGPQPYLSMRYVEGRTLAQLIEASRAPDGAESSDGARGARGAAVRLTTTDGGPAPRPVPDAPRDISRVARLFESAARALHEAHEAGLVHRDVKPGNLMVTPDGDPVLLDFGLAHEDSDAGGGARLTQTGALVGTPAYMSPEQLTGQHVTLDRRTDVYSLGVSLFEALTLRLPFQAATRDALYQKILAQEPPRVRRLNARVSTDLGVVVETAMAKDRDRRYQTAADLAEDLRRVQAGEPIRARPVGAVGRSARWARRNPLVAASAATAFAVLAAGLAVTAHLLGETHDALLDTRDAQERTKSALDAVRVADTAKDAALSQVTAERDQARALGLAHASASVADDDPMLSLLFAREAASIALLPDVVTQLHAAVQASACIQKLEPDRAADPVAQLIECEYSPDGRHLATTAWGPQPTAARDVRIWNSEGRLVGRSPQLRHQHAWIEFSPDGSRVATWGEDGPIQVWSLQGHELASLERPGYAEGGPLVFSRDGSVVYGGSDGRIRVWDAGGRQLLVRDAHGAAVNGLCFSVVGDRLISAGKDGSVRVWTAPALEPLFDLRLPYEAAPTKTAIGASVRGDFVAVDCPGEINVWDAEGRWLRRIDPPPGATRWERGRIAGDGRTISAVARGSVWIHDVDGTRLGRGSSPTGSIHWAAYSADGTLLMTEDEPGGRIDVWTAQGSHVHACRGFRGLGGGTWSLDPAGLRVAADARDGNVYVFSLRPGEAGTFSASTEAIRSLDVSSRGDLVVTTDELGTVRLHDAAGTARAVFDTRDSGYVRWCRLSPDGSRVLVVGFGSPARVFNLAGAEIQTIRGPESAPYPTDAVWSPTGDGMSTVHMDGTLRRRDASGREIACVALGPAQLPDWTRAFGAEDGSVLVWTDHDQWFRAGTGDVVRETTDDGRLSGVAVAPDGSWRVGSLGTRVRVEGFGASAGPPVDLRGHGGGISDPGISPDGGRIVTPCSDGRARVFDRQGRELFALPHPVRVTVARFTADGERIVTGDVLGTVRIWLARPDALVELAGRRTFRDFGDDEVGYYKERLGPEQVAGITARQCVSEVFGQTPLREEALERIRNDPALDPAARARALELAASYKEDDVRLNDTAWRLVWRAECTPAEAARGLRIARRAAELVPANFNVVNTLGVAEYRAGRLEDALATLRRCDEGHGGKEPWDTVFLAMTLARLGRPDEARAALDRTRALAADPARANDPDLPTALAEAEGDVGR